MDGAGRLGMRSVLAEKAHVAVVLQQEGVKRRAQEGAHESREGERPAVGSQAQVWTVGLGKEEQHPPLRSQPAAPFRQGPTCWPQAGRTPTSPLMFRYFVTGIIRKTYIWALVLLEQIIKFTVLRCIVQNFHTFLSSP